MPYVPPPHSLGRPGHRRSYSNETGAGAFVPLDIPRRQKQPVFHFRNDNDDDDSSSPEDTPPPTLKINPNNSFRLTLNTESLSPPPPSFLKQRVPFPRSSPVTPPPEMQLPIPPPTRPSVPRTSSTPILLSSGKPLKSSLKSSSSSPHIPFPAASASSHKPNSYHLRARSAPATPQLDGVSSPAVTPPTPKNVHFPSKDSGGLETVRIFNRSARPASVSLTNGADDTETETEGESQNNARDNVFPGRRHSAATGYPFPNVSFLPTTYELDSSTSPIPSPCQTYTNNIYLESLGLTPASNSAPSLTGTLLVRNISYEKTVALRFTLDDWHTTSEVLATYMQSLPALPKEFVRATVSPEPSRLTLGDLIAPTTSDSLHAPAAWDRFKFTLRLGDYAFRLEQRVLWLVTRYSTPTEEYWDNNSGKNYRVGFQVATPRSPIKVPEVSQQIQKRSQTYSAPAAYPFPVVNAPTPPTALSTASSTAYMSSFGESPQSHAQHAAMAQTTLSRLRRLNLKNYARPTVSTTSPTESDSGKLTEATRFGMGRDLLQGHPATTVHWPWGETRTRGDDGRFSMENMKDDHDMVKHAEHQDDSHSSSTESEGSTPPTSPILSAAKIDEAIPESQDATTIPTPVRQNSTPIPIPTATTIPQRHFPPSPPSLSHAKHMRPMPPMGGNTIPNSGSDSESGGVAEEPDQDSVYQAFVRQWCFAQGSPGGPGVVVG